ncbi:14509_t:CDS:1 [Cetraspora pellucida]|uniref:14509_t:CDS:1 n=1 Tax=Cetraspora pellucida TaxID=1433469 RepID=A0A9N9H035_9GLOM|nr:14509_t:CDS:1 [Cetraspora pellucida]
MGFYFLQSPPKMATINLNYVLLNNDNKTYSEDEIFTIEISKDKKYELVKDMIKNCLALFFNSVLSTKICLSLFLGGHVIKPMCRISEDFPNSLSDGVHIYILSSPKK